VARDLLTEAAAAAARVPPPGAPPTTAQTVAEDVEALAVAIIGNLNQSIDAARAASGIAQAARAAAAAPGATPATVVDAVRRTANQFIPGGLVPAPGAVLFPLMELTYTWRDVPDIPEKAISDCMGKCNLAPFDGAQGNRLWPAQTLLCQTPNIRRDPRNVRG